jgi:hypothetical protein
MPPGRLCATFCLPVARICAGVGPAGGAGGLATGGGLGVAGGAGGLATGGGLGLAGGVGV